MERKFHLLVYIFTTDFVYARFPVLLNINFCEYYKHILSVGIRNKGEKKPFYFGKCQWNFCN